MPGIHIVHGGRVVGSQRWSVGHWLSTATASPSQLSTLAEACFAAFKSNVWVGSAAGKLQSVNTSQMTLDSCRAYLYPDVGDTATAVGISSGVALSGTASSFFGAAQVALVATLENGLAGRRNKGRMYLPQTAQVTQADLTLTPATTQAFANSVAGYLSAVRVLTVGGAPVNVVVSRLTALDPITSVSVDGVLDTQRSRRNKITAQRSRAALIVP